MLLNLSAIPFSIGFLSKILLITSLILSKRPMNFFRVTNIPPPSKPAKISPTEIFSVIHLKVVDITVPIFLATFEIQDNTDLNILPKLRIPLVADSNNLDAPPNVFDRASEIFVNMSLVFAPSLIYAKKSPMEAAASKRKSVKLLIPLD